MVKLQTFIISEQQGFEGDKLVVKNPNYIFRPTSVPGNYSLALALGFVGEGIREKNTFSIKMLDPKGGTFNETPDIELVPPGEKEREVLKLYPDEIANLNIVMDLPNAEFRLEGKYTTIISLNGEELDRKDFFIVAKEKSIYGQF
ncbi:hypothetical protein HB999_06125 [Listeria booriae]|uniref:Uncharacterized protein n=1 Tax=Listeria booriae TaxID=1552123 RepID=A0A841XXB2_9LIST|nr:hypothetical protein [Listeria booriae]MBC1317739.1 hypothetical protein [Listeria booriae]MBC6163037.1 hypothetical protein [Listeria booriae]